MYLTIPVTLVTSERTFSALRRLKNNCPLMHCQKSITDTVDTVKIAKTLLVPTNNAKDILEKLSRGLRMAESKMSPPRFKTLRRL